uniref:DZANK-type domain-containing protein n=1 Tax=Pyrodinium bahamense TaxID=73915 RepID=A0A7S0BBH4_9DINO
MAGLTSPTAIVGHAGDFAPDIGGELGKMSIGNLGILQEGGFENQASRFVSIPLLGCTQIKATDVTEFLAWFDFLAVLVFFANILFFRFYLLPRNVKQNDREALTCRDYTVEVDCLPRTIEDMAQYEEELKSHFMARLTKLDEARKRRLRKDEPPGEPPEICEIVLVRDFHGRLSAIKSRAELRQQLAIADHRKDAKATKKLETKIEVLSAKVQEKLDSIQVLPVMRAYVTLNTPGHKEALLYDYRFSNSGLFRCCQSKVRCFHGKPIRVMVAPEPSNLLWENQDVNDGCMKDGRPTGRTCRKVLTNFIFALLIIVSMACIYLILYWSSGQSESTTHNYLGDEICDPVFRSAETGNEDPFMCMVSEAETWTLEEAQETKAKLDCFCLTKGYQLILWSSVLREACFSWVQGVATKAGIMTLASFTVVIINSVMKTVFAWLAVFERSSSVSGKDSSLMNKLFVAQTLNTGAVPFLVSWHAPDALRDFISVIPGLQFIGRGDYADLVRGWYTVVGLSLMVNMATNAVSTAAQNLAMHFFNKCKRWCCTRERCFRRYVQAELLQLYTNPEFNMCTRYAQLMMTVYVTMLYSSGLPLLYFAAAVYMFAMYWVDKIVLLRGSKRPPLYDSQMPKKASQTLIYAVPLHCFGAILMFGQPCTFPSNTLGGKLGSLTSDTIAQSGQTTDGGLGMRISRESTWMLFGLFLVFVVIWVIWTLLWVLNLGAFLRCLLNTCGCGRVRISKEREHLVWERAKEFIHERCPPASYKFEDSRDFLKLAPYLDEAAAEAEDAETGEGGAGSKEEADPTAVPCEVDDLRAAATAVPMTVPMPEAPIQVLQLEEDAGQAGGVVEEDLAVEETSDQLGVGGKEAPAVPGVVPAELRRGSGSCASLGGDEPKVVCQCGAVQRAGYKFCGKCGTKATGNEPPAAVCQACGAVRNKAFKFCGQCGAKAEP